MQKINIIKTVSGKVVAQSIAFRVVSNWRRAVLSADAGLLVVCLFRFSMHFVFFSVLA